MPTYACPAPFCSNRGPTAGYCPTHKAAREKQRQALYDNTKRDRIAKAFYASTAWQNCRAQALSSHPSCAVCPDALATDVHHVKPLSVAWALRLDPQNLMPVCARCHSRIEIYRTRTGDLCGMPQTFVDPDA